MAFEISLYLKYLFFVWFSSAVASSSSDQHLVCKPVAEVFDTANNQPEPVSPRRRNCNCNDTCRPGKQGPMGMQGRPGPPGSSSIIEREYERINTELRNKITTITKQLQCYEGVVVANVCYRLLYRVGVRVNYAEAKILCTFHGGVLAEIPTEEAYNAVMGYLKTTWSMDIQNQGQNYFQVWLDSVYQDGSVTLTNGGNSYVRWFPGYPNSHAGHNRMAMEVPIKPTHPSTYQGMFNIIQSHAAIPFCTFSLIIND